MVLKEITNIDDGIGSPDLALSMALLFSWVIIMLVLIRGIHSSGKASYFLAIFPYVIMIILLIRSVTLEGASMGIIYFFKPQWDRILDPQVGVPLKILTTVVVLTFAPFLLLRCGSQLCRKCFSRWPCASETSSCTPPTTNSVTMSTGECLVGVCGQGL